MARPAKVPTTKSRPTETQCQQAQRRQVISQQKIKSIASMYGQTVEFAGQGDRRRMIACSQQVAQKKPGMTQSQSTSISGDSHNRLAQEKQRKERAAARQLPRGMQCSQR